MSNLDAPHLHLHLARVPGGSCCANVKEGHGYMDMDGDASICARHLEHQPWANNMRYHKHLEKQTFTYSDSYFAEVTSCTYPLCYQPPPLGRGDLVLPPWNLT